MIITLLLPNSHPCFVGKPPCFANKRCGPSSCQGLRPTPVGQAVSSAGNGILWVELSFQRAQVDRSTRWTALADDRSARATIGRDVSDLSMMAGRCVVAVLD
jgi:hypothetical protein